MKEIELDKVDFRNYIHDIHDIDVGTPSGMGEYLEWLEDLICDPDRYNKLIIELNRNK